MVQILPAPLVNSCKVVKSAPLVSIIVPSYNCERYIQETLSSVVAQTLQDWELILVDDGSTDRTVELAEGFDPRVRVVRQRNAGVCVARNRGFRESRGRFVNFLDHDDYWYPGKLQCQIDWFERRPDLGVVFTSEIWWHARDGRFPTPAEMQAGDPDDALDESLTGWVYHLFMLDCHALMSATLIRRSALEKVGLFDEALAYSEDWDLFLRLAREVQFARVRWPYTLYRQHARQGSRMARDRDFRTELLLKAERTWGLASPDGRAADRSTFNRTIAKYRMQFGRHHVSCGNIGAGVSALADAWRRDPWHARYLAMAAAALVGWRPKA